MMYTSSSERVVSSSSASAERYTSWREGGKGRRGSERSSGEGRSPVTFFLGGGVHSSPFSFSSFMVVERASTPPFQKNILFHRCHCARPILSHSRGLCSGENEVCRTVETGHLAVRLAA